MSDYTNVIPCPYCGSFDSREVFRVDRMPTILYACKKENASLSEIRPLAIRLCFRCALCFNATPLSAGTLEMIYKIYRHIRPRDGIGVSKYNSFIEMLKSHTSKNEYLVEIGSSDGFLIDTLSDLGYAQIEGIEPSQEWKGMCNEDKIRNCFFSSETHFNRAVDVFYLMHVMEHLPSLKNSVALMRQYLADNGRIIFEVPYFTGFHHQHLLFFSSPFLQRLAQDLDFDIVEEERESNVMRACLRKRRSSFADGVESTVDSGKIMDDVVLNILMQFDDVVRQNGTTILDLKALLETRKTVFWWGTGITSIMALSLLGQELCEGKNIVFIDSDSSRRGLFLPLPYCLDIPIKTPDECLAEISKESVLIIASSFAQEILATLEDKNITLPDSLYSFTWR